MAKLKKGDKLLCIDEGSGVFEGKEYMALDNQYVSGNNNDVFIRVQELEGNRNSFTCYASRLQLINSISNPTNMNLQEKFVEATLGEPEKSFRKVGVTDSRGLLTVEGSAIFANWLFGQHQDVFKKEVVDPILKEEKKK